MKGTTCIVLLVACAAMASAKQILPSWVDCTDNSDCAPGYCCARPYERYSYPACRRMSEVGDTCRPGGFNKNGTLYYPDNSKIILGEHYMMLCPCNDGLVCDRNGAVCKEASHVNSISDQTDSKKDD